MRMGSHPFLLLLLLCGITKSIIGKRTGKKKRKKQGQIVSVDSGGSTVAKYPYAMIILFSFTNFPVRHCWGFVVVVEASHVQIFV